MGRPARYTVNRFFIVELLLMVHARKLEKGIGAWYLEDHGRYQRCLRGADSVAESVLVGLGAAHQLRRTNHARVRRGMGGSRVEDARRAHRQCDLALLVRRLKRPPDDGAEQYRADYRSSAGRESARDCGSEETVSATRLDSFLDGGIEARSLASDCAPGRGRRCRWPGVELRMSARDERARHGQRCGASAGVYGANHRMGEGGGAHSRAGEADAEYQRHSNSSAR